MQVEQLEERWCPSFTLVTSRTALAGMDSVNWGTLVPTPPPSGIYVTNPVTIISTVGHSISVSKTIADSFFVTQQVSAPPYQGNGNWNGNFAVGDWVLDTEDRGSRTNPITLNFGATAVAAGGAQIQPNRGSTTTFTAKVEAFDANGKSLASFTEAGTASDAADNSAIFIGISSSSANISQIALSITKISAGTGGDKSWFAINQFDFRTSVVAAAPAISQPASAIDLAPLASSLLIMGQAALPAAPVSGFAAPATPSASQSGVLPTSDTTSAVGNTSVRASQSTTVSAVSVTIQTDPGDPTKQALVVDGTANADTIVLSSGAGNGVTVEFNGTVVGDFVLPGGVSFGRVIVNAGAGNDIVRLAGGFSVQALLFGGDGDDTLDAFGSTVSSVLVGGAGNDNLIAGAGSFNEANDLLIGGLGADTLSAGSGEDILIGATTDFDADLAALCAIMAEWGQTGVPYATRVSHLQGMSSGGLNGAYFLTTTTVHDDATVDILTGGSQTDWFFAKKNGATRDSLTDLDRKSETVTQL